MAQQPLIYSTMISDHNSWVFASMWLLVCREKGKGSFCTLGNQRAFHTGISPSIKASSFVINAQDAIKYYTTPLLPLNTYIPHDNNTIFFHIFLFSEDTQKPILDGDLCSSRFVGIGNYPRWSLTHLRPPFTTSSYMLHL